MIQFVTSKFSTVIPNVGSHLNSSAKEIRLKRRALFRETEVYTKFERAKEEYGNGNSIKLADVLSIIPQKCLDNEYEELVGILESKINEVAQKIAGSYGYSSSQQSQLENLRLRSVKYQLFLKMLQQVDEEAWNNIN